MRHVFKVVLPALFAAALILLPGAAYAQTGAISGSARDTSGAALPGVLVEVSSPQLIEKVRSTTTDNNGRYQITALPVGTYKVTFTLQGFNVSSRENIALTSDFTANVNGEMKVGDIKEVLNVTASTPLVDVQNARQQTVFSGEEIRELPTERNVPALLNMVPGITSSRGICPGGVGVFCSPVLTDFNAHASALDSNFITGQGSGLNQGRIMVDGMVINSGNPTGIQGMTAGYNADIANAQEISFTLSGSLGESETGGASINIVPRTGGNRYSGNFFTSYTDMKWFDKNNETRDSVPVVNQVFYDYDVTGSYGGPIVKDRLWFFSTVRSQGKEAYPQGGNFYPNVNFDPANPTAKPGINYQPDRSQESVRYTNEYKNINLRLTVQATQKNKFNVFWDEQDSCQDPCTGVVSTFTSPESWWSVATRPNHLGQLSWTNPMTNRLLLEAGLTMTLQHYDTTQSREFDTPTTIPRVSELGVTAGLDDVATQVNSFAGVFGALTSGSLNDGIGAGGSELRNSDNYRSRASASYITGSHNAKFGYEGQYYMQKSTNNANDMRLTYNFTTPAGNCAQTLACGNTSLYYPNDPNNLVRRPVPTSFVMNTGIGTLDDRVWFGAIYLQDQWTLNRFTLSGALRYDHAESSYGETCVGPDIYVPVQIGGAYDGQNRYCTAPSNGVDYNDITPRFGMAWDVFGTGKTSVKVNVGKYLAGASLGGLYSNVNPARRTTNTLQRTWSDTNGNRVPDCRMFDFTTHTDLGDTCGAVSGGVNTANRYGRDPLALDAEGRNPITTTNCGQALDWSTDLARAYCQASGDNLVDGWNARRYEWQYGLGVQHELLPRLSAEVTYNKRKYGNQTISDIMGLGCDKFNGTTDVTACQQSYLDYSNPNFDFFSIQAPVDPRLPNGGGYTIRGLSDEATLGLQPNNGTVVTFSPELSYGWHGIDTNFSLRGKGGFRISGGTSTGRGVRDTCFATLDAPNVKGREGNEYKGGCIPDAKWTTNARANMSYTIPKIDVLTSALFQYRPGPAKTATLTFNNTDIAWDPESQDRATIPCTVNGAASQGCFYNGAATSGTSTVDLLDFGDQYGESIRQWDLKFAKNIRFANKRLNIGVDVYNLFNSDAATGYTGTYTAFRQADGTWGQDNPATPAVVETTNNWNRVNGLISPRFARFQIQFDF